VKVFPHRMRNGSGRALTGGGPEGNVPSAAFSGADMFRRWPRRLAGRGLRALRARARRLTSRSSGACRWLPPGLTLDEFFDILRRERVTYVVLRWFEELPQVEPGHDIDILVDDQHVDFVQSLLADRRRKGSQHLDIYSVSGLPGSDLGGIPCFPPRLARHILTSAVWLRDTYRVPALECHFLGLAYHAAYHKGYSSGLSTGCGADEVRRPGSHDYEAVLADLAARLGESVIPTLDGVDRYLADHDLRPSLDMLRRLAPTNPWIEDRFLRELPDVDPV
jgi:hypothetical protein